MIKGMVVVILVTLLFRMYQLTTVVASTPHTGAMIPGSPELGLIALNIGIFCQFWAPLGQALMGWEYAKLNRVLLYAGAIGMYVSIIVFAANLVIACIRSDTSWTEMVY